MNFTDILINLAVAFTATTAYCVMSNIPKKHLLVCGILGIINWLTYILLLPLVDSVFATFFATAAVVLFSRLLAVIQKCPVTILMIPGVIPLAPGSAIYYTAYYFVTNDAAKAAEYGLLTTKLSLAIVLGIIVVTAIPMKRLKSFISSHLTSK